MESREVDHALSANKGYSVKLAFIVSLGGFLFGFDASVISGVIGFITPQFQLDVIQQGWVVSSPSFAAMFAMLVAGTLSDRVGRRDILIVSALLYIISAVLSAIASSYEMLVAARMLGGVAFGAALVLAPLYIGETTPAELRGRMVSIQQLNIVLGFSVSYFSNYLLLDAYQAGGSLTDETVWRWMLGVEALPALLYLIFLFFIPRSPRWLLYHGKVEQATKTLRKLFQPHRAEEEKEAIELQIKSESQKAKVGLGFLFKQEARLILIVGLVLAITQQITGVNAIFFYATTIFEQSGVGTNAAFSQAIYIGLINVFFTVLAMLFIDRLGRKPLLLIGLLGIALSMGLTSYGFYKATYAITSETLALFDENPKIRNRLVAIEHVQFENDVSFFKNEIRIIIGNQLYSQYEGEILFASMEMNSYIVLFGILGFVASFAFSLGPVMWVLFSEIFPAKIRGAAIAFFGFINSLTSTLVQLLFPWELANWGNTTSYLIFSGFAILGFLLLAKWLPETKGRSLEQLEKDLIRL
ncbi:MAG: sugar porter family MFS transporter [Cyclobacteriaceae bacterium]